MRLLRGSLLFLFLFSPIFRSGLVAEKLSQDVLSPKNPAPIYITLWFDTEDFILPASDDAVLRLADFLSQEGIQATFKMVGEKARVLERRGRADVIAALKRHAVGYHSDWHSLHPTPAERLSQMSWEEGVQEFLRTEKPGFEDVGRIFGQLPVCYGQPGSSWAPQSYAALRQWGVELYLDEGSHVGLDQQPFWYGGLLNVFHLGENVVRVELKEEPDITKARGKFEKIRQSLQARGGGLVSVYYHPCEFVHEQFWDAVNFSRGANPSPRQWRLPPQKSPAAIEQAFHNFQAFVRQMKNTPGTRFVAGRELLALYPDSSRQRKFSREEILDMARSVQVEVNFQRRREFILSSAEILSLLNRCLSGFIQEGRIPEAPPIQMAYGPPRLAPESRQDFAVTWDQFASSCLDVQAALEKNQQIPAEIWLGSESIGPADYLVTLAKIVEGLISHGETPKTVTLLRGKLIASQHVADDKSNLWGWVIFPEGFHSPKIMEQAKLQAWTLKPAFFQTTP